MMAATIANSKGVTVKRSGTGSGVVQPLFMEVRGQEF